MSNTRVHSIVSNPSSFKTTRRKLYLAMLTASQFMVAGQVLAAPEGGQVVGGAGSIDQAGSKTTIHQATERMAIDWQSFDVKADERVQFIQPKSTSVALNRVLSNRGSEILGRIDANGKVILVNPNGIVFGQGSQINVGGMIASGLSIDSNDFMNGEFTLTAIEGTEGKVINSGIINAATGGSVTLLGKEVKNEGLISAHLGSVNLAAGKAAVVTFDPSGMVGVKITQAVLQNDLGLDAAVINSGEIMAQGGRILITASVSQDIFSQAVNHGGMNQANSVVMNADGTFTLGAGANVLNTGSLSTSNTTGDAGQIVLLGDNVSNSGSILADSNAGSAGQIELNSTDTTQLTQTAKISAQAQTSGVGGDIKILGNKVGLFDSSSVNASGENGGGQILIGGDETGKNKNIRNADFIFLGENSSVKTDALLNGDGGKLISFASDTARIYGSLSARGGSEGGNGGFIETSGLKGFEIKSTPDVGAAFGLSGTWLIDPYNIEIVECDDFDVNCNSGETNNISISGTSFTSNGDAAKLDTFTLEKALAAGATVIVKTGIGSASELGNITLSEDLIYNFTGTATLQLEAHNNIIINETIRRSTSGGATGVLNVSLIANSDNTGGGNITIDAGESIETQGGYFYAGVRAAADADGFLDADILNPKGVNFTVTASPSNNTAISTAGGNVKLNVTGAVTLGDRNTISTDGGNFTATSQGFNSIDAIINTASGDGTDNNNNNVADHTGGGDILIVSIGGANNVDLGIMKFGYDFERVGGGTSTEITTLSRVGSIDITSAGNVTLHEDFNYNNSGARIPNTTTRFTNLPANQNTFLTISANGNITLDGIISDGLSSSNDEWGDSRDSLDITLTSTSGSVFVNEDIFTAGGNFIASAGTFDSTTANINTERANANANNPTSAQGGNATWSNGGNVSISALATVSLGNIITDSSCINSACIGNLIVQGGNTTVTQAASTFLNIHGTSTFDVGAGNVTLNGNNIFTGNIKFTSAGTVALTDTDTTGVRLDTSTIGNTFSLISSGDITQLGSLAVTGATNLTATNHLINLSNTANDFSTLNVLSAAISSLNLADTNALIVSNLNTVTANTNAGAIIITAGAGGSVGALTTGTLTADGGTANTNTAGKTGGPITLSAKDNITTGIISTNGSSGNGTNQSGGTAGNLSITSTSGIITAANVTANGGSASGGTGTAGLGGNITFTGATEIASNTTISATGSTRGDITFSSTLNSDSAPRNLTLTGKAIAFGGDVGVTNQLGTLNINATADINSSSTKRDFSVASLLVNAANFYADSINTFTAATSGGAINVATTGTVNVGAIDTHGDSGTPATLGGILSLTGNSIILTGDVNTRNGNLTNAAATLTLASAGTVDLSQNLFASPFTSALNIIGSSGADTFKGQNIVSAWAIGTTNTVGGNTFSAIENITGAATSINTFTLTANGGVTEITGGSSGDTYQLNGVTSLNILGGSGNDTFNISANATGNISGNGGDDNFNILAAGLAAASLNGGGSSLDTISGWDGLNNWTLNATGNSTLVNGVGTVNFSGMGTLNGGIAVDNYSINSAGITVTINAGEATPTDNVIDTLTGLSSAANAWTLLSGETGKLNSTITFTEIETLDGGALADTFTTSATFTGRLNGNLGADVFNLNHEVSGGSYGNSDNDTFNINVSGLTLAIDGGSETDIVTAPNATNIWALTGANSGTLTNAGIVSFSAIETINGNVGTDTLNATTGTNAWLLSSKNAGTLNGLNFSAMENLTGNTGVDRFGFSSTFAFDPAQIIDAVGAGNIVDFSLINNKTVALTLDGSGRFNGVQNADTVQGNNANSTLTITSATETTWAINTPNDGVVSNGSQTINFINFSTLNGTSANNIFNIASTGNFTGTINGGTSTNTLTNANGGATWTLTSANAGNLSIASVVTTFTRMQTINGSATDTLVGSNQTNNWNIATPNAGTLGTLRFTGMANITGGTVEDIFTFASAGRISGILNGGDGLIDKILTSNDNNTWTLTGPNAGNLKNDTTTNNYFSSFQNIEKLVGGVGNDVFIFNGAGSIVDADGGVGPGTDTINYATFSGPLTVTLGDAIINGVHGIESFIGNGNSTLRASNTTGINTWNITGTDKGAVILADGSTINFEDFKNLSAGGGGDIFDLRATAAALTGVITGGAGADEIKARNDDTVWNITNTGTGNFVYGVLPLPTTTTNFLSVEKLTGSAAKDTFILAAGTGFTIVGGDSSGVIDVLDLSAINQDITLALGGSSIGGILASGIEDIRVNTSRDNTLTGYAGGSNWTIDNLNEGVVSSGGLSTRFKGFYQLNGADNQDDTFTFTADGRITGFINGGTGASSENKIIGLNTIATSNWEITNTNSGNISAGGNSYLAQFTNIQTLNGGSGNDVFDFSTTTLGKIGIIDGGTGTTNTLKGRSTTGTWGITAIDTANITDANGIYVNNFKNINALQGGTAVDTFTINTDFSGSIKGGDNNDIFNIHTLVTSLLDGEAGNNRFVFFDAGSLTTNAIGGSTLTNIVDLSNRTSDPLVTLNGTDIFGVTNVLTLLGNASQAFTLGIASGTNTWTINGTNSGTVNAISFFDFKNLTGGNGNDTFDFSTNALGKIDGTINGGTGTTNTLKGRNIASAWDITAVDTAKIADLNGNYVNNFKNINVLQGGTAVDTFTINTGFVGGINGGDNGDIFRINAAISGNLLGENGDDTFAFSSLNNIGSATSINGGSGVTENNILIARDAVNTWNIANANAGSISGYVTSFSNIQTLQGGTNTDTFTLGAAGSAQTINGGGGTGENKLTGRNAINTWRISSANAGDVTNVNSFSNIHTLQGGSLEDNFTFSGSGSVTALDGGIGGANTVTGRNDDSIWTVTGPEAGFVALTDTNVTYATFTSIQNLIGGDLDDIFSVGNFSGTIKGGGGLNGFVIDTAAGDLIGGDGNDNFVMGPNGSAKSIDGGIGDNTLTGRNSLNTWTISNENSGFLGDENGIYVTGFSRIQNLKGGSLADNFMFNLAGKIVSIDGGPNLLAAGDTVTGRNTTTTWDLSGSTLTDSDGLYATYRNIEILQGGSLANTFNINQLFAGDIKGGDFADNFNVTQAAGNLYGAAGADTFIFSNTGSASLIDGGTGTAVDVLNLTAITRNISVGVGATATTNYKITALEQVNGNGAFSNTLVADATANTWNIDGNNQGKLNTLSFTGFENLTGNTASDNFTFTATGMTSGIVDGGTSADVTSVIDTVNLTALAAGVTVQLGNINTGNLNLNHIETITAAESLPTKTNKLIGSIGANSWLIDGENSGSVSPTPSVLPAAIPARETVTNFSGFSQLEGGENSDTFEISKNWLGAIDGGEGRDFVDYSNNINDVAIVLGAAGERGVTRVEGFIGNSDSNHVSTITLAAGENVWDIGAIAAVADADNDGVNDGLVTVNGTLEKVYFINFNNIVGSAGKDTFNVTGIFNGTIQGKGSDDILNVTIAPAAVANLNFVGGLDANTNSINIFGGADNYAAIHTAEADANGKLKLSYSNPSNQTYSILYSNVANINDALLANTLTLTDTQNADVFTLTNNAYSLVNSPSILYSNKNNLIVAARDVNDRVILNGVVAGLNEVSIRNATVSATANGSITANSLNLSATGNVGSLANRLVANISTLSVSAVQGDIYLQAPNNLTITEFSGNRTFDVISAGNITSNVSLASFGDFKIATAGNILLDKENILSGNLGLSSSGGNINLRNDSVTNLTGLSAQNLIINSTGAINGNSGAVKVGAVATLTSGSDINLNNIANDFNSLLISSANTINITDLNFISLGNITATKDLVINSVGMASSGVLNAANVTLDAGQGLATLANISATTAVNVEAQGIIINGNLAASVIDLNGTTGDVALRGKLDTAGKQTINVVGKSITQDANITSGGSTSFHASENLTQNADIESAADIRMIADGNLNLGIAKISKGAKLDYTAGGTMSLLGSLSATNDIAVTASGDITMGAVATSNSINGNINFTGANIAVAALNAANGNVVLNANGAVIDSNTTAANITAKRLVVDAANGIGDTDSLESVVSELSLSNASGSIKINNTGSVQIDRLRTNGNIELHNLSGDVVLDTARSNPFVRTISDNPAETNALTSLGTANANYNIGSLAIEIDGGNLTATGVLERDKKNPDITAYDAVLSVRGDVGEPTRPLVVYVKHLLAITADGFNWTPYYGFGVKPEIDQSTYKGNIADLIGAGSEQLVQVEALDEVNPAIFTGVRNYVYDDIAILMPADQRYDDKDAEE
jgi:filamentous hemagglutinin family protein